MKKHKITLTHSQLETVIHSLDFEEDCADMHGNIYARNKIRRVLKSINKQVAKQQDEKIELEDIVANTKEPFGHVTIKIEGDGFIKEAMIVATRKALRLLMGKRKLFVNNVEVNPYE